MQVDVMEDGYTDHDLFSLSSIKVRNILIKIITSVVHLCIALLELNNFCIIINTQGKRDLVAVEDTENEEEINKVVDSDDEDTGAAGQDDSQSDLDSDEERKRLIQYLIMFDGVY